MREDADEIETTDEPLPPELTQWLKKLLDDSGLSIRKVALAMEYDRPALTRWFSKGTGMSGPSLWKFLSAVGARIEPAPPGNLPRAVNAELADLRAVVERRLEAQLTDQAIGVLMRLDAGEQYPLKDLEQLADEMRAHSEQTALLAGRLEAHARSARR